MRELLSIKQVAEMLHMSEKTIRTWKFRGAIPDKCFIKLGGKVFLDAKAFDNWIESQN